MSRNSSNSEILSSSFPKLFTVRIISWLMIHTVSISTTYSICRNVKRCQEIIKRESSALQKVLAIDTARKPFEVIVDALRPLNLDFRQYIDLILRMLSKCKSSRIEGLDFMVYFDGKLVSRIKQLSNKELEKVITMERTIKQLILNAVFPRKAEPVMTSISPVNGLNVSLSPEPKSFSRLLEDVWERERQTDAIYQTKLNLRQKIYLLLSREMKEKIDLYLIGSSLTHYGSKCSDTDLCLIIYDLDNKVDPKYETKEAVLTKLEELSEILVSNGMASKSEVIPAMVPILKFNDTLSGIEINLNVNRVVTIRNTHLLHTYSQIDKRVPKLIFLVKLWAKKNGINSAYNKSLTSYSIALMVIHYLQNECQPPVVPNLLRDHFHLFTEDITRLRLMGSSLIPFVARNNRCLGDLFIGFFEYYCLHFNFDKVISIRFGTLLDKDILIHRPEMNGKIWQWKCHICIEEPFNGDNTSHAVHNCQMFKEIVQKFMDTYQQLTDGSFTLSGNGLPLI